MVATCLQFKRQTWVLSLSNKKCIIIIAAAAGNVSFAMQFVKSLLLAPA